MKCDELITYLSEYIDNELEADLLEEARLHLATCHNCQVVLESTRKTIQLYHEADFCCIPAERRAEIFSRLKDALAQCKSAPPDLPAL
jgi:hypothetical protein